MSPSVRHEGTQGEEKYRSTRFSSWQYMVRNRILLSICFTPEETPQQAVRDSDST